MNETYRKSWDRYSQAWKETTRESSLALLRECVVTTCTYRDPNAVVEGRDGLADYMVAFHAQVPGGWFDTTGFLTHHDRSLATWNMMSADAKVIGAGMSYAEYDGRGQLVTMTGFFAPSGA